MKSIDKITVPKLSGYEEQLKHAYENGGKEYVENKLSYAEYAELVECGKCIISPYGNLYREFSERNLGTTVVKVGTENNAFKNIFVTLHPRYSYPIMHNHNYIEIIYVKNGQCKHFVEDRAFTMKKGDVCILAPKTMHALSVTDDETLVMNIMVNNEFFDREFLDLMRGGPALVEFFESIFYKRQLVCPYVIYHTGEDVYMGELTARLYHEVLNQPYAYEKSMEILTQQIFIFLIRGYEMMAEVASPIDTEFNSYVVSVLGYLGVNYNRTTLAETAQFFGYTPTYLGKMLKHYTGKNYKDIITDLQMKKARELLDAGKLSVTEISQEIGCFDNSHFNKKFKAAYGMTPREYKKRVTIREVCE